MANSINDLKTLVSSRLGFARTNEFLVQLPTMPQSNNNEFLNQIGLTSMLPTIPGVEERVPTPRELNILCKNVGLPGKRILSTERRIGMELETMAYGYAVDNVSMTFHVLNDYGIIEYFNNWRNLTIDEDTHVAKYANSYKQIVNIIQLRKPVVSTGQSEGPLRLSASFGGGKVYQIDLIKAYPISVSTINLSNDLDGLVEVTVELSYKNWRKKDITLEDVITPSFRVNPGQIF